MVSTDRAQAVKWKLQTFNIMGNIPLHNEKLDIKSFNFPVNSFIYFISLLYSFCPAVVAWLSIRLRYLQAVHTVTGCY